MTMNPFDASLQNEIRILRLRNDGLCRGMERAAADIPAMLAGLQSEELEVVLVGIEAGRKMMADRPALTRARSVLDALRSIALTEQSRRAVVAMAEALELERVAALE
ncbi:MAG: hypothetical protein KJZ84_02970 [Bryobacteraceae bacterium]|nr:hypothetical protein [Solibacteraceae bacterium]MCL4793494.1 hypothetical protein [Bryobacteraceae bacterium]